MAAVEEMKGNTYRVDRYFHFAVFSKTESDMNCVGSQNIASCIHKEEELRVAHNFD